MTEERGDTICVLQSAVGKYWTDAYMLSFGEYKLIADWRDFFSSRAEAIMMYDVSGRKEPLYDNADDAAKLWVSNTDLGKMKRIR